MLPDESIVTALESWTHPLSATNPTGETDDLLALEAHADADVVGVGEATHGTREFFALKTRVVRFLVEECGFRTVAFEADVANALGIDEYVRRGTGTPGDALDDLLLWVWKTEGVRNLLAWLREFNSGRSPDDQVRFFGVSLSDPSRPADHLRTYLQAVDPEYAAGLTELDRLADEEIPREDEDEDDREAFLDSGLAVAGTIRERLEANRERYVEAGSVRDYRIATHLCRHLEQDCEWNRTRLSTPGRFDPEAFEQRGRYMAENVGWCLDSDPGEGVVLWAHNTHVKRGSFDMAYEWASGSTMGEYLDREFGSRYRPLGTDFGHGQFLAVADGDERKRRRFAVDEPLAGSLTTYLDRLDQSPLFLDLRGAGNDPELAPLFDRERRIRAASALLDSDPDREEYYMETDLLASFDGLFYVAESTPSRPL